MKKILTTGNRAGVFKLLELMLQRSDLTFVHSRSFSSCLNQAKVAPPTLLLIDCQLGTVSDCAWLLQELQKLPQSDRPKALLVVSAELSAEQTAPLEGLADGRIQEPLIPPDITRIGQKYL